MKSFFKSSIAVALAIILCLSIVAVAWSVQTATISGINITTKSTNGPVLYISPDGNNYSQTMELSVSSTLKPATYELGHFYDQDGTDVSSNTSYYVRVQVYMYASESCSLKMTWDNTGNLPINIAWNNMILTNGGTVRTLSQSTSILVFYIYVNGEDFTQDGTANITINFEGV